MAYRTWKVSGSGWSDFTVEEAKFDAATRTPVASDPLLGAGASHSVSALAKVHAARTVSGVAAPLGVIQNYIQEPESYDYYCGPAAAMQILVGLGYWTSYYNFTDQHSQSALASATYLDTTTNGTDWYPAKMAPALNKWTQTSYYVTTAAPSLSSIEADTVSDVDSGYSYAADNIVETASGATHLTGYPTTGANVYHWQSIYGYSGSGSLLNVADPAYSSDVA